MDYSVIVIALKVVLISFHKSQYSLIRIIKLSFRRECLSALPISGSKRNWYTSYLCIHLSWSQYNNQRGNQPCNVWVEKYITNLLVEETRTVSLQIESRSCGNYYIYVHTSTSPDLFSYLNNLGPRCGLYWLRKES